MIKFSLIHGFKKPTPEAIRRWANAGFVAATSISGWQGIDGNPKVASVICAFGFITKLLSLGFYYGDNKDDRQAN